MYQILYHPRAIKFLKKLSHKDSVKIVLKIKMLLAHPTKKASTSKSLLEYQIAIDCAKEQLE